MDGMPTKGTVWESGAYHFNLNKIASQRHDSGTFDKQKGNRPNKESDVPADGSGSPFQLSLHWDAAI